MVILLSVSGCSASAGLDLNVRKDYQAQIDKQANRFDASAGIYVRDSQMFVTEAIHQPSCAQLCAAFEKVSDGNYKIYLPIGFQAPENEQEAAAIGVVTELVYWNPVQHTRIELPGMNDEPILLPGVLTRRTTDDLEVGETAYIATSHIHPKIGSGTQWVVETATIWHEPIDLEYNMTVVVRITRTESGVDACAPSEQQYPLSSAQLEVGLPATLSHAC
jgi:hypothetical protein